jgi:acyl-CoA ligase (AMP-forming) (exosortase A-associated)
MTTMQGIAALLQRTAMRSPDQLAVIDHGGRITYGALAEMADRLSRSMIGLGLERHDRVAVYLDKSIETVATIFAACAAGLVVVPINPKLKPHQVRHIVADSGAAALVTTRYRLQQLADAVDANAMKIILTTAGTEDIRSGVHSWSALAAAESPGRPHRCIDMDPSAILYTSGSTGMPKGVVVSHRNLILGAESVNAYLGTTREDVILSLLPLSFDAGLSQVTTATAAGAKLVLHNYIQAKEAVADCAAHGVTSITAVPPLWTQLAAAAWGESASRAVRLFANTGGHMPAPLLASLRSLFPRAKPFLMYGLTEAFRSTYLDPSEVDRRPGSIGKAIPDAEILVLRPDGSRCDPGESGELVHRGGLVTLGYWNDPARTAQRFRPLTQRPAEGLIPEMAVWSGDIVKTDEDGFLYFVGRRDEMIKSSGYRISPTEIESVLFDAPGVNEAAVFAVPDEALGQLILAAVVAAGGHLDAERVRQHCGRLLPPYMVPHIIEVDALPRTPNGKIDRPNLPSLYRREAANA